MKFIVKPLSQNSYEIAYAFLRIAVGILLFINGWNKWYTLPDSTIGFPDPLGVGANLSLYLVIFSELICGFAIMLGLFTRIASLPVIVTFFVAVFLIHKNDHFDVKQTALLYLIVSTYFIINGSGSYSLDKILSSSVRKNRVKN